MGDDLIYTCEGCTGQPEQVANIDLTPNPNGLTRATLCLVCLALLHEYSPTDPLVVALRNRIEDFRVEWPDKADANFLFYASSLASKEPDRALAMIVDWHRSKKSQGLA